MRDHSTELSMRSAGFPSVPDPIVLLTPYLSSAVSICFLTRSRRGTSAVRMLSSPTAANTYTLGWRLLMTNSMMASLNAPLAESEGVLYAWAVKYSRSGLSSATTR